MGAVAHPRYFLAKHIFPCLIEDELILLDLRNDKYSGLDHSQTEAFQSVLGFGLAAEEPLDAGEISGDASLKIFSEDMVGKGILTGNPFDGKEAATVTVDCPPLDLTGYDVTKKRRVRPGHIFRLVVAAVSTRLRLRFLSLEHAVNRVKTRKARHLEKCWVQSEVPTQDKERIRELIEIFRLVRLFLFTSKNFCLYDSLVLVEFLAPYGIYPDLVVGVKMRPFQAHAWVQDKNFIYNGCIREIDLMNPIMVV